MKRKMIGGPWRHMIPVIFLDLKTVCDLSPHNVWSELENKPSSSLVGELNFRT